MEFLSWLIREYAKGFYSLRLAVLGTLSPVSPSPYQGEGAVFFLSGASPLLYTPSLGHRESQREALLRLYAPPWGTGIKGEFKRGEASLQKPPPFIKGD